MKSITKKELIQFAKDNCFVPIGSDRIEWRWQDGVGSRSSEEINEKIAVILKEKKNGKN